MEDSILFQKSKEYALAVIRISRTIRAEQHEYTLADQFLRSGTSIGANIREAYYGSSKMDFISKLQIALKECAENEYWMELLTDSNTYDCKSMFPACAELKRLLIASVNTAKKNT